MYVHLTEISDLFHFKAPLPEVPDSNGSKLGLLALFFLNAKLSKTLCPRDVSIPTQGLRHRPHRIRQHRRPGVECIGPESMRESSVGEVSAPLYHQLFYLHTALHTQAYVLLLSVVPYVQVAGLPIPQVSVPRQLEILWEGG